MAQIFFGLQLKIFTCKPREFYSIEIFAVQSMSRQSCYVMCKVLCIFAQGFLLTLSLPVYQNAHVHVNSVCEKVYSIRCLFYFIFSVPLLTKYKGKDVLRRIPHASDGWKLNPFAILNKQGHIIDMSMGIYQLPYGALRFSLTQVSLLQFFSHTKNF